MKDPEKRLLYTRGEVAAILGVHPRTVTRLMANGDLKAVGAGPGKKITKKSVYEYVGGRP